MVTVAAMTRHPSTTSALGGPGAGRSVAGLLAGVVVLAVALGAAGWWVGGLGGTRPPGPVVEAATAPGVASPGVAGSRLVIGAVGLDVPLQVMVTEGGVVDPPSSDAAFLLADHGVAPSRGGEGTVFVAMHALRLGGGPGNALVDIGDQAVLAAVGSLVEVDGVAYTVVSAGTEMKTAVARDAALWDPGVPDRLVLITCMPREASSRAVANVVVVAVRVP